MSNDHPPTKQPLELTNAIRFALVIVLIIGIVTQWQHWEAMSSRLVRHSASEHQFNQLGVSLKLPEGWTYLAVDNDRYCRRATFVHAASSSIASLRILPLKQWPPQDHSTQLESFRSVDVDWVFLKRSKSRIRLGNSSSIVGPNILTQLDWTDLAPAYLGRVTPNGARPGTQSLDPEDEQKSASSDASEFEVETAEVASESSNSQIQDESVAALDLVMFVVTHDSGEKINEALRELCESIEFLDDGV